MTRFHALRVHHEELASKKRSAGTSGSLKRKERYGKSEDTQDTEWGFLQPRKRAKKTYRARQAINETQNNQILQERKLPIDDSANSQLGILSIPTPYLNKSLARPTSARKEHMFQESVGDRTIIPPSLENAQEGRERDLLEWQLYTNFETVLEYTTREDEGVHKVQRQTGAPSLFAMCLKNIPRYIANEEEWQKEDDDEDQTNVTAETYNQLEDFGQGLEGGWKHLRSVVQAHAVHIVKTAIEAGYIHDSKFWFTSLCWKSGLKTESWSLLESVAQVRQHAFPALPFFTVPNHSCSLAACFRTSTTASHVQRGKSHDPHTLLMCAWHLPTHDFDKSSTRAHILRLLLESGQLASEWLSCPCFGHLWQEILKSLSKEDENSPEAFSFILSYLLRSGGVQTQKALAVPVAALAAYRSPAILEASTRTLSSLCAMLATIALVDTAADQLAPLAVMRGPARAVRMTAIEIQRARSDETEDLDEQVIIARMSILLTDMIVIAGLSGTHDNTLMIARLHALYQLEEVLISREDSESKSIEYISRQLCDMSKCYARATSKPDLNLLQHFLDKLIKHETGHRRYNRFVRRLALDTAIMFAQENPSPAAESYVHHLEMGISQFTKPNQPVTNTIIWSSPATAGRPGFRWEQGVCEWVASTPASLLKLKKAIELGLSASAREAAQTPCANAVKRWTAPSQVFVGVVVPSTVLFSSPTKPGRDDADTFDTPLRSVRDDKRLPFEDSGVFMDCEEEDVAVSGAPPNNNTSLSALTESDDVSAAEQLATQMSPLRITSSSSVQAVHTSCPSPQNDASSEYEPNLDAPQPRTTRSTKPILLPIKHQPARPRQHTTKLKAAATRKTHLLQEDESEDELSINESDCCAGAFEVTERTRTTRSSTALLGATLAGSGMAGRRAISRTKMRR